jgi:hypothetical protein
MFVVQVAQVATILNEFLRLLIQLAGYPTGRAPGPFSLADPERARQPLTTAGFANLTLDDVRVPMYFEADPTETCQFVEDASAGCWTDLTLPDRTALGSTYAAPSSTPPTMASGTARPHG